MFFFYKSWYYLLSYWIFFSFSVNFVFKFTDLLLASDISNYKSLFTFNDSLMLVFRDEIDSSFCWLLSCKVSIYDFSYKIVPSISYTFEDASSSALTILYFCLMTLLEKSWAFFFPSSSSLSISFNLAFSSLREFIYSWRVMISSWFSFLAWWSSSCSLEIFWYFSFSYRNNLSFLLN